MKRYKMTLTILSPVHIGAGVDIDPLEYVVKDGIFYRLDLPKFISQLPAAKRQEFNQKASEPNPLALRDFIHRHAANPEKYCCFKADAGAFDAAYQASLKNPNRRMEITLMTRSPGAWRAYIPGSSVKGAIRTAFISELAKLKKPNKIDPKFFEKDLLGFADAKQDPFRCLRISDAPLPAESPTFIDKAEIFKLKKAAGPDPAGIQMFYEQVFSMLDGETIQAVGALDIDDKLPKATYKDRDNRDQNAVSMTLNAFDILKACRAFYLPKMKAEHEKFYRSNADLEQNSQRLLDVQYADNEFPIRLGRFSHVECTTVDEYRQPITRRTRDGKNLPWGTTRTLSAGAMPMGWVKVRLDLVG